MDTLLQQVSSALEGAAKWVFLLLPSSPFRAISASPIAPYMHSLGWLIPVAEILALLSTWIIAVGVFYMYQMILRLIRAIE